MFTRGSHADIKSSLDAIGAAVAVFSLDKDDHFVLVSANDTFAQAFDPGVFVSIGKQLGQMLSHLHHCEEVVGRADRALHLSELVNKKNRHYILGVMINEDASRITIEDGGREYGAIPTICSEHRKTEQLLCSKSEKQAKKSRLE